MGTIERLEALDKAATAGPWIAGDMGNGWPSIYVGYSEILGNLGQEWTQDGNGNATESVWETYNFIAETRNALHALLAVAKAARVLSKWTEAESDGTIKLRDDMYANNALADLCEALAQLEATP